MECWRGSALFRQVGSSVSRGAQNVGDAKLLGESSIPELDAFPFGTLKAFSETNDRFEALALHVRRSPSRSRSGHCGLGGLRHGEKDIKNPENWEGSIKGVIALRAPTTRPWEERGFRPLFSVYPEIPLRHRPRSHAHVRAEAGPLIFLENLKLVHGISRSD